MIPTEALEQVHVVWRDGGTLVEGCPPSLGAVRDWFRWGAWSHLPMIAEAVRERSDVGTDGSGFRFSAEPHEEPFEGVELYTPLDTADLPEDAFDRLVHELLVAARDGLVAEGHPATRAPWWPGFVRTVEALTASRTA